MFVSVPFLSVHRVSDRVLQGVLILAGVVISDAKYTSIVILIWVSNIVVTIAEIISFDFD